MRARRRRISSGAPIRPATIQRPSPRDGHCFSPTEIGRWPSWRSSQRGWETSPTRSPRTIARRWACCAIWRRRARVIRELPEKGITEIGRPIGVVGAVVPSTNPVATPVNNVVNALKCGNAIVLAPSPKGTAACAQLVELMHAELGRAGIERDLVQMFPAPANKTKTNRLMQEVDLVIVTGSQDNVRRAYSSGTPAIGVGAGNAAVIVEMQAPTFGMPPKRIVASKTFDNATSCSSENAVIVVDAVYATFARELAAAGGAILSETEGERVVGALWRGSKLNPELMARDIAVMLGGVRPGRQRSARDAVSCRSGERRRAWAPALRGKAVAGAGALSGRRFCRRQDLGWPSPGSSGRRAFRRAALHDRRARGGTRARPADLPCHREPGALLCDGRLIRKRDAVFAVHGMRELGREIPSTTTFIGGTS